MKGSRKQVMSWQMQQKEGGKDFLTCKRGLTDLTEAFGPLLRNAQPSTETSVLHQFRIPSFISTNSSCSSSFQLPLFAKCTRHWKMLGKGISQSCCHSLSVSKILLGNKSMQEGNLKSYYSLVSLSFQLNSSDRMHREGDNVMETLPP